MTRRIYKEDVVYQIDRLIELFTKIQDILGDYDNIISVYSENNLEFSYEDCEYWKNQLADAKQNIMNYWSGSQNNYDGSETDLDESVKENKEDNRFDNVIIECLKNAGILLSEAEDDILELDEYEEDDNSNEAEKLRDEIYSTLLNNQQLFRADFDSQFDSDDDIEYEINEIVKRVKNGQPIESLMEVSPVFDEKLTEMVRKYIDLTSK